MKIKRLISLSMAICLMFSLAVVAYADCTHSYSGACDDTCNECGATRLAAQHVFENSEDDICDQCGYSRKANLPGDVNSDGKVNNKDLAILRQFLNGWDVTLDEIAADVTADGKVNNKDLAILRQFLNGWDVTLQDPQAGKDDVEDTDNEDNWLEGWY